MKRGVRRWVIIGVGVTIIMAVIAAGLWYGAELRPANARLPQPVAVSIAKGERTAAIAGQLQQMGLIRSRLAFQVYLVLAGLRGKIEAGYYELSPADSTATNAKIIARGIVINKAFLVREGGTVQQIVAQAEQDWLRGADVPAALKDNYPNSFLAARPPGASLEGYLFPDTYDISPATTPHQLIQEMLNNFNLKVTPAIVAGMAREGLSLHQGLTLASMIEDEASKASDRPIVAQVFLKRLSLGMPLESDVTSYYGASLTGIAPANVNVKALNSLYNTYTHTGLPPGPVDNPGLTSIEAVVNPAATNYLYFVADSAGNTHFATTYAEHQANVAKYLGQ